MTYGELEINTEIMLREKPHDESRTFKKVRYRVAEKYPNMCIAVDRHGRRRGVAVGELVMNGVITQEACYESLRDEHGKAWHKKGADVAAGYAP